MQTRQVVWVFFLPLVACYPPHKQDSVDHLHYEHSKQPDVIVVVKDRPEDKHYYDSKVKDSEVYALPVEHRDQVYVGKGDVTVDHRDYGHHDDYNGHHLKVKQGHSLEYNVDHHEDHGHYLGKFKPEASVEYRYGDSSFGYDGGHIKSEEFSPYDFGDDDDDDDDDDYSFHGLSAFSLDDYRR
ncbi:hypothetical protein L9F63_013154 [Diploptera punctata]|uniref:Cuticle protein n=1 Tax=Diploptera punctata TaxID=6984 RepID=A0AAD8ACZ1_DIPPU|nr:hypothetical protein L9F63_013154 [Diploptera punctata]